VKRAWVWALVDMFRSSLWDFGRVFDAYPALKRWCIGGRPSGTGLCRRVRPDFVGLRLRIFLRTVFPATEKAQAWELAPYFVSITSLADSEGNYDMLFGFIFAIESWGWRELGGLGGLTRFRTKAVLALSRRFLVIWLTGSDLGNSFLCS
jgi:hypothetical protein